VADVARVDELLHVDGDEVMAGEPDEIGRGYDGGGQGSEPEPAAAQVVALRREEYEPGEQSGDGECDGVFGEHPDADGYANADPVALVFGAKETSGEEGEEYPREQVEGGVLHQGAEDEGYGQDGEEGDDLRDALAT